jgi:hypothetical protein
MLSIENNVKLIYGYLPTVFGIMIFGIMVFGRVCVSVLHSMNVNTTGHLYLDEVCFLLQLGYSKIIPFDTLPTDENWFNLGYFACRCENVDL